jgi:hypothetical protein
MKYDNEDVSEISVRDKENYRLTPINRTSKILSQQPTAAALSSTFFYPF